MAEKVTLVTPPPPTKCDSGRVSKRIHADWKMRAMGEIIHSEA